MKIPVIMLFVMVLAVTFVSAQSVPGDLDGDGCVNFSEISA